MVAEALMRCVSGNSLKYLRRNTKSGSGLIDLRLANLPWRSSCTGNQQMSPILERPINQEIIEFLSRRGSQAGRGIKTALTLSYVPPEDPGFGIHPDAVQHFWCLLPSLLPIDCRLEVLGFPALVHPPRVVDLVCVSFPCDCRCR